MLQLTVLLIPPFLGMDRPTIEHKYTPRQEEGTSYGDILNDLEALEELGLGFRFGFDPPLGNRSGNRARRRLV
jgi:hypothetical protein